MRTQRFITIVCLLLWTVAHLHAYEKRDLLQKEVDFEKVKSALIMEQKWVPYPDYSDRAGWDKLLGDYKEKYIRKGESYLDYEWKSIQRFRTYVSPAADIFRQIYTAVSTIQEQTAIQPQSEVMYKYT